MAYLIHARDGAAHVILKRATEEAALERAAELRDVGWPEVEILLDKALLQQRGGGHFHFDSRAAAIG